MKNWRWIVVTLLFGVPAFLTGKKIWPASTEMAPNAAQLPFFIFLSALEAVAFGIGVSFLLFGYPLIKKVSTGSRNLALLMYLTISWLLISWWPHDNMHAANGTNMDGLLRIEYIFHSTLIVSALILAYCFFRVFSTSKAKGK